MPQLRELFLSLRSEPRLGPEKPAADTAQLFAEAVGPLGEAGGWAGETLRFPGAVTEPAADIFCLFQTGWWLFHPLKVSKKNSARGSKSAAPTPVSVRVRF